MSAISPVRPAFRPDISFEVDAGIGEERSTIVHCHVRAFTLIRIWPSTYLVQEDGTRKKLIQAYHITPYPHWKAVLRNHCFTLVFEGLDRGCLRFDLLEDIPEPGGFHVTGIGRNAEDVYRIDVD